MADLHSLSQQIKHDRKASQRKTDAAFTRAFGSSEDVETSPGIKEVVAVLRQRVEYLEGALLQAIAAVGEMNEQLISVPPEEEEATASEDEEPAPAPKKRTRIGFKRRKK